MKDEEAYVEHTLTSPEWFAAEIMESQQNMELLNRLLESPRLAEGFL